MNNQQFVQWLKGFVEGVHHYNISPKQWDYLKKVLNNTSEQSSNYQINQQYWTTNTA